MFKHFSLTILAMLKDRMGVSRHKPFDYSIPESLRSVKDNPIKEGQARRVPPALQTNQLLIFSLKPGD